MIIHSSSRPNAKPPVEILIDEDDYELVRNRNWTIDKGGYAIHYFDERKYGKRIRHQTRMHRLIMGAKEGEIVDHINGNRLDNRKSNLRIASSMLNCHNSEVSRGGNTPYRGVFWDKRDKKYIAKICVNYDRIGLGYFDTALEAAIAYRTYKKELMEKIS